MVDYYVSDGFMRYNSVVSGGGSVYGGVSGGGVIGLSTISELSTANLNSSSTNLSSFSPPSSSYPPPSASQLASRSLQLSFTSVAEQQASDLRAAELDVQQVSLIII